MIRLYNTRTRSVEEFKTKEIVGLYTCGPTVYNFAHIGNLRTYVFEDVLRRILEFNGLKVNHVMNITDVGHLTDDADQGEDKMEKGSKREGRSAWDIAKEYEEAFKADLSELNILPAHKLPRATDHIQEQIDQVQTLIDKGFTYRTSDGIYFDTTKLDDYGKLSNLNMQNLQAGSRVDMGEKKNPHDFALWKFSKAGEKRQMEWDAFGRKGFPGWHIECSAMSTKYLGEQFDIHTGGIDHIAVHHTNEIAQAEATTGIKPWVNFWLHGEFLLIDNDRMAKSGENFITLQTIKNKGYSPLDYRYFLLQTHYRKQLNFSWEALDAAKNGLQNLRDHIARITLSVKIDKKILKDLKENFTSALNNDLNTPQAIAILWEAVKEKNIDIETVDKLDKVLGLKIGEYEYVPENISKLMNERKMARNENNFEESDRIRNEINNLGYSIEDTEEGQVAIKN